MVAHGGPLPAPTRPSLRAVVAGVPRGPPGHLRAEGWAERGSAPAAPGARTPARPPRRAAGGPGAACGPRSDLGEVLHAVVRPARRPRQDCAASSRHSSTNKTNWKPFRIFFFFHCYPQAITISVFILSNCLIPERGESERDFISVKAGVPPGNSVGHFTDILGDPKLTRKKVCGSRE